MGALSALPHPGVSSVHSKIGLLVVNGNAAPTKQETLIKPLTMASQGKDEKTRLRQHTQHRAYPAVSAV